MSLFLRGKARRVEELKKNRMINIIALKNSVPIRRDIKRYMNNVIKYFEEYGALPDYGVNLDHTIDINNSITKMYIQAVNVFSKAQFEAVKRSFKCIPLEFYDSIVLKQEENTYIESLFQRLSTSWISENALKRSTLVAQTSRELIKGILTTGYSDGLLNAEIARKMKKAVPIMSRLRAATISITETHNAATYADLTSTSIYNQEFNLELQKEWVATEDERTREAHNDADGQKVAMNDSFLVDGESLSRPGDDNGSAKNIIRCRCSLGYGRA